MNFHKTLISILIIISLLTACKEDIPKPVVNPITKAWYESITPITINGDEYYGQACSITRVRYNKGVKTAERIFKAPSKVLTSCRRSIPKKNYLDYDGEYIILNVSRQTFGAGSHTGERFRSKDFTTWQEYIGVTWRNSEEYEAWRNVGSTSSRADAIKKVIPEK